MPSMAREPICFKCQHFNIEESSCLAYPLGRGIDIPMDIVSGADGHTKVQEDQVGEYIYTERIEGSINSLNTGQ